jgi:hypothetical protein
MADDISGVTVAMIAAVAAIFSALFSAIFNYFLEQQRKEDELLETTLSYFDGKIQRRSIGIALVEGIWETKKKKLDVIVPVLVNQIYYLLLTSKSRNKAHEKNNLDRLIVLSRNCIPYTSDPAQYYSLIRDAIHMKYHNEKNIKISKEKIENNIGITVPEKSLKKWYSDLGGTIENLEKPVDEEMQVGT